MCMVSAVYDYGRTIEPAVWTRPAFSEFQEIIRRIEKLDSKLDQPDCHDPEKATWMRDIEARLAKLEEASV